ncbi:hypothetical protein P4O66_005120, partial [Electrophorus voltai]
MSHCSSGMESPLVDDDICILKHETAYMAESPVAACAGDESVASHFALVTAYEDIKKRLRDTEKENTLLRKRVKQLEDKVFRPEAPPSEGPQYMNKAFSAYRGIYMEKKDLQAELNKLRKERAESERHLTEQLQAKELELLQLKSEMETSQAASALPVQCRDDVERNSSPVRVTAPRPPSAPPVPCSSARPGPSIAPLFTDGLQENCWKEPWPLQRPAPVGSPAPSGSPVTPPSPPQPGAPHSPSHPRPSDALFWENPMASSS